MLGRYKVDQLTLILVRGGIEKKVRGDREPNAEESKLGGGGVLGFEKKERNGKGVVTVVFCGGVPVESALGGRTKKRVG